MRVRGRRLRFSVLRLGVSAVWPVTAAIVQDASAQTAHGGSLGYGIRNIAVPVEAVALLGYSVQVVDLDRTQLDALPDWTAAAGSTVAPDESIRVGLNRN